MHKNGAEFLNESYEGFLEKIGWEEETIKDNKVKTTISRNDLKRLRSEMIIARGRELNPFKKKMEKLEEAVMRDEEKISLLENELVELAQKGDSRKIQESSQQISVLKKNVDKNMEELVELTTKHDEIFQSYEKKLEDLER